MPTYEYECKSCSHNFDAFQSITDEPLKICPKCGKELRRLINGGSGVIFKGTGFYVTDRKGASAKSESAKAESARAESAKADPANTACAGCAKAETCPAVASATPDKKASGS